MIEINLIPEELKAKLKKEEKSAELKKYIFLVPIFLGLLAIIHLYAAGMLFMNNSKYTRLEKKWKELEPQKKNLEGFQAEYQLLTGDAQIIQKLTDQRALWSAKLNILSGLLPSGIWFTDIALSEKAFTLRGTVASMEKEEISLINKFLIALKAEPLFFKSFKSLELGPVQVKKMGMREVVDFVFTGTLN